MQYGLGIDLGTTQTAAAVRVDGRIEIVRLGGRRAEIPSLVFVRPDGGLLIGEAAERRGQAEPGRLAREFKRRIGDPVPILAGGVPFSAHALTAKLLRHVLDEVVKLQDGPPAVLTVTHPANWGPYKREQLDQALRLADTGPVLLRTEPEAAALQHATARRIGPGETVAVYDLGGGTFDAAVLRREGEGFQLLGEPEGIEQLGGADFDEAVFGHVLAVLGSRVEGLDPNEPEVVTALARLRRDCVEAKEALSFDTEVMIPVALPGVHTRVRLNRSELESMIAPALADTVAAMHRALRGAKVAPEQLDAVLLAGGSSRIPLISQLLSTAFERPVVADPHPEHSIAMGAAVSTALITGGVSPFAEAVTPPPAPLPAGKSAVEQGATGPVSPSTAPADATGPTTPATAATDGTATPAPADVAGTASSNVTGAAPTSVTGATPAGATGATPAGATGAIPTNATGAAPAGATGAVSVGRGAAGPETQPRKSAGPDTGRNPGERGHATPGGVTRTKVHGPVPAQAAPSDTAATQIAPGVVEDARPTRIMPGNGGSPANRPVSGGTVHTSAASVAFSRGAAAIPGQASLPQTQPTVGSSQVFASAAAGRTAPPFTPGPPISYPPLPAGDDRPDEPRPKRNGRMLVLVGVLTLAVIAGTSILVALNRGEEKKGSGAGAQAPTTPPPVSPSVSAPPYPTDTMLIRVDTGGDQRPERKSAVYLLTPGKPGRTSIADTGRDVLPEWSRDRKRLALTRYQPDGGNTIWVMDADGKNSEKVVDNVTDGRVAWSADDRKLAFMREVGGTPQIFIITLGESKPTQLTWAPGKKDDPAWSPDGDSIAYWAYQGGQRQIFVLDVDNPDEPGRQITDGDNGPGVDPAWSPDGTTIAYTRGTGSVTSDIWVIGSDGEDAKRLTDHKSREMDPSWSPDGSWLAFTRGVLEKPKIVIMKADGSGETTLTKGDAREGHPCWS
jgi:molecular chaperone DnaK